MLIRVDGRNCISSYLIACKNNSFNYKKIFTVKSTWMNMKMHIFRALNESNFALSPNLRNTWITMKYIHKLGGTADGLKH